MRALLTVKVHPVANDECCMLQRLEAMAVGGLLLERADHPLDQAILLGRVRRDELVL